MQGARWKRVLGTEGEMAGDKAKVGTKLAKRAHRFAIELPLRYREKGTTEWLEGITMNISASGVLFRCAAGMEPRTALDLALVLPVTIPGEAGAEIVCHGMVVRNALANDGAEAAVLAATVQHYRIAREKRKGEARY
jgi:hypothetical protein